MTDTLLQQALRARAEQRPADAVRLWHQLLRETPDDWRSGLELGVDLAAQYKYTEADPAFRRAARALPDAEWFAHYAGLWTYHMADLAWLAQRGRAVLARRPGDAALHLLLGNILLQRRHWAAAERHLARAPPGEENAAKHALAGLYRRLAQRRVAEGPAYEVAYVNLDRNVDRRRVLMRELRHCPVPVFRVAGVEGRLLPEPAVRRLAGAGGVAMRGTLGCFLGHASAWETMLARGLSHCLVVEDDVVPLLPLPAGLGALGLPDEWDICFVNDRLQPRWPAIRIAAAQGWEAVPLAEAFASFPADDNAPGADGYLLSAKGARTLLAWVEEDGFSDDVDWRLLTYGLGEGHYAATPGHSHAWGVFDTLRHLVRRSGRLQAYVLHPALIRTIPITSDREDDNRHRRS